MRNFFDTRFRWVCALVASASILIDAAAIAGTIRHDRSDQMYRSGARDPALNAVVQLKVGDQHNCSAVLIAPDWVLTAAHCFISGRGALLAQTVLIQGVRYDIGPNDIFINPEWLTSGNVATTIGDIALIRLPRPIRHVRPIRLNTSFQEVGQTGYIAGYGRTGNGRTGSVAPGGVKRLGVNVIDATEATVVFPSGFQRGRVPVGSRRALLIDFDNPQRDSSTLGDSAPLNMEYSAVFGDSGGPLLLRSNRVFTVAGLVSGGVDGTPMPDGSPSAFYGTIGTFTRVAAYRHWIQSVINGNGESFGQMLQRITPADAAAMRQRFAAQQMANVRNGISVIQYQGTSVLPPPRQSVDWLSAEPTGGILALVNDAKENVRKMTEHAETEDSPVVYFDCASCGGDEADGQ